MRLVFDPVIVARGVLGLAETVASEAGRKPWRQVLADAGKIAIATVITAATVSHHGVVLMKNGQVPQGPEDRNLSGGR